MGTIITFKESVSLARYAVPFAKSLRGREHAEPEDPTRTPFQHDRDRIIHSKAFRRLSGKTQVFVATYGDHFRDRLTHSLEVSQVARDVSRALRLNEDLCEAIALAHDLGHTPFGHAGQDALNELMQHFGKHFEHNEQSARIVTKLEKQFPNFDGLNLTGETLDGLAKHQTLYDRAHEHILGKTLEAQIVDLADEIAYHNHDLDDGLRSKLFTFHQLNELSVWRMALKRVYARYGKKLDALILRHRAVSQCMSLMIADAIESAQNSLKQYKLTTLKGVISMPRNCISFSARFEKEIEQLRKFLWVHMYQSDEVLRLTRRGQKIIRGLFKKLYAKPRLLPKHFYARIDVEDPREVVVKDYIAGMTDQFAANLFLTKHPNT